jgi:hypothetical protein
VLKFELFACAVVVALVRFRSVSGWCRSGGLKSGVLVVFGNESGFTLVRPDTQVIEVHPSKGLLSLEIKMINRCKFLLMIGVTTLVSGGVALAQQGNPGIAPINSRITTVKTYAELGAEWWQWAVQAPDANNPLLDDDGKNCRVGQQGPVWFLAGTLGSGEITERECEVPEGKAIFFPVINNAYFSFLNDPPETRTADFVRTQAENGCDSNSIRDLSVTIDGVEVARPARFVTSADQSPIFQAQLPTDNVFGLQDTDENASLYAEELVLSPGAHQGFYIYLKKPLAPGDHTIEWTATWDCFGEPFSENMKYNLNVLSGVSGQVDE